MSFLGRCGGGLAGNVGEEHPDVARTEGLQSLGAEQGGEVEPHVHRVLAVRAAFPVGLDHVVQPVRQPLGELGRAGGDGDAAVDLGEEFAALGVALGPGLAVGAPPT